MGKEDTNTCYICGATYARKDHLYRHIEEKHEDPQEITCEICGEVFHREDHVVRHNESFHKEEMGKKHQCDLCGKKFKRKDHLFRHMSKHGDDKLKYKCTKHDKKYGRKDHLHSHIKQAHSNISSPIKRNHVCKYCGLDIFKRKDNMYKHIRIVHAPKEDHTCSTCGLKLNTKDSLREHVQEHITAEAKEKVKSPPKREERYKC